MPPHRLTGSDHAILPSAFAMRRNVRACPADWTQSQVSQAQTWSVRHDRTCREAAIDLLENHVAAGRRRLERPRYARLHASIAERPLEWAWQHAPDNGRRPGRVKRIDATHAHAGWSARRPWLGGLGLALLAVGVISAVATVQSSRPLPFETWARHDLMQGAGDLAGGASTDVIGTGPFASPPMIESVAAGLRRGGAAASISAAAQHDPADAALAWDSGREPPEVDIAALGPILASAESAAKLAAEWPARPPAAAHDVPESRSERLRLEPPRPVFKPALLSSLQLEPDTAARARPKP